MRSYDIYHVDAFTSEPLKGNAAAVIPDAEGLSDGAMQAIAREMNLSETAFVFPPKSAGCDLSVRFFSPAVEVPFCGHATVALHHVRAAELGLPCGDFVQMTKAGPVPVRVGLDGKSSSVSFTMMDFRFAEVMGREERRRILGALGADLKNWDARFPMQRVYAGVAVALTSRAALDALAPDMGALSRLSSELGFDDFVVFTTEPVSPGILTHVRVFAPAMGIDEDPVTGSAGGPLAAYLVKNRLVDCEGDSFEYLSRQGEAIGRPGTLHLKVTMRGGEPLEVSVGGTAVTLFKAKIEI